MCLLDQNLFFYLFICPCEHLVLFTSDIFFNTKPKKFTRFDTRKVGNLQKHQGMESKKGLVGQVAQSVVIQHPGREDEIISSVTVVLLTHKSVSVETTEKIKSIIWVELFEKVLNKTINIVRPHETEPDSSVFSGAV